MPLINLKSDLTWRGSKPPNAVPDKGTLYQETRFEQNTKTGDVSTNTRGYAQYAKIYTSPLRNITSKGSFSLTDSKYNFGVATRLTQGGEGYPFPDYNGIIYDWKPVAHTGFHSNAKYGDIAGDGKGDSGRRTGFLQATYTTNSPIDDMYKKYNLQDASFQGGNWWSQPYILRGIQIKQNKPKPQRWGFNASFDDGLIRGGILTATERTAFDVIRLGKWATSPRGLLWVAKQVGLGLTNAPVERIAGKVALTQIQPGVTSLLSVAGNAFGLHFTRHAIPFLNDVGSYENVLRAKRIADEALGRGPASNRLVKLRDELLVNTASRVAIRPGLVIPSLSTGIFGTAGVGGAQSILGLTGTPIKRYVDTREGTDLVIRGIRTFNTGTSTFSVKRQYAQGLNSTSYLQARGTSNIDSDKRGRTVVDDTNFVDIKSIKQDLETRLDENKLGETFVNPVQRRTGPAPKLNDYATLSYGQIRKKAAKAGTYTRFDNFITDSENGINPRDLRNLLMGPVLDSDYTNDNVVSRFGYLHYGAQNTDTNTSDYKWVDNSSQRDIIDFRINGIRFRAYIDSISDSFSPTIDTEQPLGSPIAAVRYSGVERTVSVAFKVAVLSQRDLEETYDKLTQLQNTAYFRTDGNSFYSLQQIPIVIGNLYRFQGYVESVSYDWDSEMPWDIREGKQVPLYCNVSVDFKYVVAKPGFSIK